MSIATSSLLLLACALVQALLTASRRTAALLAMVSALTAQLTLDAYAARQPLSVAFTACAFILVCAAMLAHDRTVTTRLAALATLCDVDDATGCLNRRGFTAHLDAAADAAMQSGAPVALLALDLDHFKQVNDRFGHLAGDAVLREVSAALRAIVGHHGVVARLGGEEFAVLLPGADAEEAGVMAEDALAALRALRLQVLPASVRLTMSVGIASERMHDAGSRDALRARADEALYAGKRNGRDRALLWAPGVPSHATPLRGMASIGRDNVTGPRPALC